MIQGLMNMVLGSSMKVQIANTEVELPEGTEYATTDIAVTTKKVSNASRTYYNDSRIMSISSIQDWYDRCPDISYYLILEAEITLHVGKATLTALDNPVKIIMTKMDNSMLIHIVPEKSDAGRLRIVGTRSDIRYNTGSEKTAGYIECKGVTMTPKLTGCEADKNCYGRGIARVCPHF